MLCSYNSKLFISLASSSVFARAKISEEDAKQIKSLLLSKSCKILKFLPIKATEFEKVSPG